MTAAALLGGLLALAAATGLAWTGRGALRWAALGCAVAGLGLLVVPWLGQPTAPPPMVAPTAITRTLTISADGRRTVARPLPTPPPPLPGREATRIDIEGVEAEPNQTLAGANAAPLGVTILGTAAEDDVDSFAFDVADSRRKVIVATLVTRDASAAIVLLDDAGRPLGMARTIDEIRVRTASLERSLDKARYYVQIMGLSPGPATYQLTLTASRRH